ncbi:arginine---tRNA ligase [Spizellomyces sp. 'palustris']|nr:arginine---tRNA ligase [Spizellomyces sp. 'palustris']
MSILKLLHPRVLAAIKAASPAAAEIPYVASCEFTTGKSGFGDIQVKGILSAAKRLKLNPQELAAQVTENLDLEGIGRATVDGPGFINIHLTGTWVGERIGRVFFGEEKARLGADEVKSRVVVDYSSPNLAKEMHVGHLRSTIIGDALVRTLEFVGADVVRQNHVGDWGTQFGMLIAHVSDQTDVNLDELTDLEQLYVQSKVRFDEDKEFADRAREYVVRLQSGEPEIIQKWKQILDVSLRHAQRIYDTLGVLLTPKDVCGESFYNDDLPNVVTELDKAGILVVDQGAKVVYTPAFQKDFGKGKPIFMVQKDGDGFGYAATDLAGIRHRLGTLKAQRVLYVVDKRQALHFRQLFDVAKRGHFYTDQDLFHVTFGTMQGKDKKPFKTRSGGTVKLAELIHSAQQRAFELAKEKNEKRKPEDRFTDAQLKEIGDAVGVGAIKYADLSKHRDKDYVFDLESMLQFEGNTAPYLMYAYTRARSVARNAETLDGVQNGLDSIKLDFDHPAEHTLGVTLLQFPDELSTVIATACPHHLCGYLYKVAQAYTRFYEACPVLKSEEEVKRKRLKLCAATAHMLKTGLGLLGIRVLEVM